MAQSKSKSEVERAAQKNQPLVEDIRLLGRILGDVIREQEGKAAFELVERIRQLVGRLPREARRARRRALDRLLKNLSGDQTVSVIRAFSYFSHLANIAEDRHHVRRRRVPRAPGPPAGRLAGAGVRAPGAARHRRREQIATTLDARLHLAGADRASDRGAAQEHPRRRARDRRAARRRERPAGERARARRQRGADPRPRHPALADAHAAHRQAHRRRRDRERALLLPRDLPAPDPEPVPRDRGGAARPRGRQLLPHGQLDRRRPRRQPDRHRGDAARSRSRARARRRCATT